MEALTTIAARPNGGATTALQRSSTNTLSSSDEAQMVRLKAWMIASYPNQEATPEIQRCWTSDWSEVIHKHGAALLVESLKRHRKESSFLPLASDLDKQVRLLVGERQAAQEQDKAQRVLAEQDAWKEQCRLEGTQMMPEPALMTSMQADIIAMRVTCEQAFGKDWRQRCRGRKVDGRWVEGMGLAELYEEARRVMEVAA